MINVLWTIFEVLINVFQGFAFCYYSYRYLNNKGIKPFIFSMGSVFSLILAATITFFNYITIFEHFWALLYCLIVFVYAIIKLKGNLIDKIFSAFFPILLMIISAAFITNFCSVLFDIPLENILSQKGIPRLIVIISAQVFMIYLFMISLKILKKDERSELKRRECMLIIIVLLISIFVSAFLNFISLRSMSLEGHYFVVLSFLGILIINITVFILVVDLSKMNKRIRETELIKLKNEYNQQYISNANTQYEVIRKLRHDLKDNMSMIYQLITDDKSDKAVAYIEDYIEKLAETETFINTNNEIVNAVVNSKLSVAKMYGINVICMCVSDFSGINDVDLCSLLSNMLENAITACKKCSKPSKSIYVNITSDEYRYLFCVKNTIPKSVLKDNPDLTTEKSNKTDHGLGVKIIKDISAIYNGKVDFYEENDDFCCNAILMKEH